MRTNFLPRQRPSRPARPTLHTEAEAAWPGDKIPEAGKMGPIHIHIHTHTWHLLTRLRPLAQSLPSYPTLHIIPSTTLHYFTPISIALGISTLQVCHWPLEPLLPFTCPAVSRSTSFAAFPFPFHCAAASLFGCFLSYFLLPYNNIIDSFFIATPSAPYVRTLLRIIARRRELQNFFCLFF